MAPHMDPDQNREKDSKFIIIGAFVMVGLAVTSVGLIFMVMKSLTDIKNPIIMDETPQQPRGLAGLKRWNIEGKSLDQDELKTRYQELYNYTFPFILREAIHEEIIPSGVPALYGDELGVSFDADTDQMTAVLRKYEDHPLEEADMQRYIDVGMRISCEYCCNARSIIFDNGERACGCAHSYAMRGLAKYLLINHPDHYTNEEILLELGKWKATFFPKQTISRGVLKYAELGNLDPSILTEMPNMVGSC